MRRTISIAAAALAFALLLVAAPRSGPTEARADAVASAETGDAPSTPASTLEQAIAAYDAAQEIGDRDERSAAFTRAARLFAAVAQSGDGAVSADLYANIGTASLQAERLGDAILAYRRALALDPDHRRASQNLQHARTLLPPWVPRPEAAGMLDSFFSWSRTMSPAERAGAAALAFLIGAVLVGAGTGAQSAMPRAFSIVPLLLWIILLASTMSEGEGRDAAVLVADDTIARASDSRNAPARFSEPLPAGTELRVDEKRDDWARVTLADGRDAWVPASSVEAVR